MKCKINNYKAVKYMEFITIYSRTSYDNSNTLYNSYKKLQYNKITQHRLYTYVLHWNTMNIDVGLLVA